MSISPNRHYNLFMSNEKQPIQHEIPQIRDFYNKHRYNLCEMTPMNKKTILKMLCTPDVRGFVVDDNNPSNKRC